MIVLLEIDESVHVLAVFRELRGLGNRHPRIFDDPNTPPPLLPGLTVVPVDAPFLPEFLLELRPRQALELPV